MNKAADLSKYKKALAEYIAILAKSSVETKQAEDQVKYQVHLAQAALMFLAIEKDASIERLTQIVSMVRQVYILNPLHGPSGKAAESAFNSFAKLVDSG